MISLKEMKLLIEGPAKFTRAQVELAAKYQDENEKRKTGIKARDFKPTAKQLAKVSGLAPHQIKDLIDKGALKPLAKQSTAVYSWSRKYGWKKKLKHTFDKEMPTLRRKNVKKNLTEAKKQQSDPLTREQVDLILKHHKDDPNRNARELAKLAGVKIHNVYYLASVKKLFKLGPGLRPHKPSHPWNKAERGWARYKQARTPWKHRRTDDT